MNFIKTLWVYPTFFFLLFYTGCDNSIQPLDRENGVYSIYGALDLRDDMNFVRIKDLNRTLQQDTSGVIDATVIIEDLQSGVSDVMQDSIVAFDGVKTHNFYTGMEILPDTRYRVSVERSDGRTVSAEAETPSYSQTNVEPVMEDCLTPIHVTFDPVEERINLSLNIGFNYDGEIQWVPYRESIGAGPGDINNGEKSETFTFIPKTVLDEFTGASNPFSSGAEAIGCHQLDNDQFYVRYTHYGPNSFESATSDSIQIPRGTGRLLSLYKDTLNFRIDTVNVCWPNC
ncbi:hypothetical protein G3570_05830 [Balneolaceae bacterium YR4-1]|uniref:DUF4249 family protein n=1 Tax=Halalkalibaculum roseum TaxID=2709311 RepID=A0A6M1SLD8_9BACT|nr:hypothetical protein [Halalkalibaculum roseum]NGP76141.1 hypothetical protein [Halalkalibaculum roseum]